MSVISTTNIRGHLTILRGHLSLFHDVTLAVGENYVGADFGYNWAGSIGDTAYYDDNGNTVQNLPDEANAVGVTVVLYQDSNGNGKFDGGKPPAGYTQTNVSGLYLFDNLPPGDYVVKFDESTVESRSISGTFATMVPTTGEEVGVTLTPGENFVDADAGFIEAAMLEGHVFHDIDSNGFLGSGETRLPNVLVTLSVYDIIGNTVLLTVNSDSDGEFGFFVAPGVYTVTYDIGGTDIPAELSLLTTTATYNITAGPGDEINGLDFGRDDTGTIGDTVFADSDGDGSQGVGEPGLEGITVLLFASDGTALLASAVTDMSGDYLFRGLSDGAYVVEVDAATLPSGYTVIPTADPDVTPDSRGTAIVPVGGSDLSMDFGYQLAVLTHSVSGTVFNDNIDGDGFLDGGEPGLGDVTVTAEIDEDGDGSVDQTFTTITAPDGTYSFTGIPTVPNVTLTVDVATLPGTAYGPTGDADSSAPSGDNVISLVNLVADAPGQDFGYEEQFGTIGGTVVHGDGDGIAEGGESPLSTVTITLTFAGEDGVLGTTDDYQQVTTTNGTGDYSFTGLGPGVYQAEETNPPGYASLADADGGTPDNIDITLSQGENKVDQDFEDGLSADIGRRVVNDADADADLAERGSEAGISGVTITLWTDPNGDEDPLDGFALATTTTTGASGDYLFDDIVEGSYVVVETAPSNYTSTADVDGTASNTLNQVAVRLVGVDSTGHDFLDALYPNGYIYDTADGSIILGGSISVSGPTPVTVDKDGSNGEYVFTVTAPGTYTIAVSPPPGYIVDPNRPATASSFDPSDGPTPTVLGSADATGGPGPDGTLDDFSTIANPYYLTLALRQVCWMKS